MADQRLKISDFGRRRYAAPRTGIGWGNGEIPKSRTQTPRKIQISNIKNNVGRS
jgi:hypothetical protein